MHRVRIANTLILVGALIPTVGAWAAGRMIPLGGLPVTPAVAMWLHIALGSALTALVLGIGLSANGLRKDRCIRTRGNLYFLFIGSVVALMLGLIWSRLWGT